MAQHLGQGHLMVYDNTQYHLNVPQLLTELQLSEKHSKLLKPLNVLTGLLEAVAIRSVQVGDPILLELFERMKMVTKREETNFEDI